MTDNEIIKALECCSSNPRETKCDICCACMGYGNCGMRTRDILDLINRQKAEIERLQELLEGWKKAAYKAADEKDEIYCNSIDRVKTAKAEAIKKFAERVKQYIDVGHLRPPTEKCLSEIDIVRMIDNLVKEMVGEGSGL